MPEIRPHSKADSNHCVSVCTQYVIYTYHACIKKHDQYAKMGNAHIMRTALATYSPILNSIGSQNVWCVQTRTHQPPPPPTYSPHPISERSVRNICLTKDATISTRRSSSPTNLHWRHLQWDSMDKTISSLRNRQAAIRCPWSSSKCSEMKVSMYKLINET